MNMICLLKELPEITKQHYCMLLKDKKCITVRWRVNVKSLLYQANSDLKLKQSWRCSIESVIFNKNISWYHIVSYVWVHLVLSGEKYHPNLHLPVNLPPWMFAINCMTTTTKNVRERPSLECVGPGRGRGDLKGLAGVFVSFWLQEVVLYWKETLKMALVHTVSQGEEAIKVISVKQLSRYDWIL